jgi:serine/threonine protein phosphatase PrpC
VTPLPDRRLHLRVVSHSEVGLVRKNNQDSGYASPHLLVVADGMGGAAAGDLASAVAINVIKRLDAPDLFTIPDADDEGADDDAEPTVVVSRPDAAEAGPELPPEQGAAGRNPLLGRFAEAIGEANTRIADLVAADYSLEGMGTTVTGAIFDGDRLALAHIGDSRAYLLRNGRLERLTHDHSWVQSLVDDGKITAEEAAYHPHRSLLLKVLSGQPANDPDLTTVGLRPGDRLLFCSDGLCGMVDDPEIAALVAHPDLQTAVGELIDAALAAGGIDNITVILAEVVDGPDPAPAGAGIVLGAADEREIPVVPRRTPVVPGFQDDDDEEDDGEEDDEASTASVATRSPGSPPVGTVDDESRYAPRPPAKRRIVRTLLVALVVLLVAAAGLGAGYAWTRTQYFVGASDGQVAIYSGLPDGIPGVPLSQVYEVQDLPVASLPPYYQAQVTAGIEVSSLDGARATVEQLKQAAARCAQPPPKPTPDPTVQPTPKESTSTRPKPTGSASATAAASARPTPTPTPTALPGQGC